MIYRIIFQKLLVFLWVASFYISNGRIFERCELAWELVDNGIAGTDGEDQYPYWEHDISKWVCIVHHATGYDTTFYANDGTFTSYGLFKIGNANCDTTGGNGGTCQMPCSSLQQDNILQSVECANRIFRAAGNRWPDWNPVFEDNCQNEYTTPYVHNCSREIIFTSMEGLEEVYIDLIKGVEEVTISCSVSGYPRPRLTWTWEGQENDKNIVVTYPPNPIDIEYFAHLTFKIVQKSHAGIYTCTADNAVESVDQTFFVNVILGDTSTLSTSETTSELTSPSTDTTSEQPSEPTTEQSSEPTTEQSTSDSTTEQSSAPTTEQSSAPTTEQSSEPTTEPSSEPTTEQTTSDSTTEQTTSDSTTEESSEPTTEQTTSDSTTEQSSEPTTEQSSEPTTEQSSEPTTEQSSEPTTEPSSEPTTEPSSEPTIEQTTSDSTTEESSEPTTEVYTDSSSFPTDTTETTSSFMSESTSTTTVPTTITTTFSTTTLGTTLPTTTTAITTTPTMTISTSLSETTTTNPIIPTTPDGIGKIWEPCELAHKLTYLFEDIYKWNDHLEDWLCLSEAATGFNSYYLELNSSATSSVYYGIFKISNRWCSDIYNPHDNNCNITCNELFQETLKTSVECSQLIFNQTGGGFEEWPEYNSKCADNQTNYLLNCSEPPIFMRYEDSDIEHTFIELDDDKTISCSVTGYPPPEIIWDDDTMNYIDASADRLQLNPQRRELDGVWTVRSTITFKTMFLTDKRTYGCHASNMAGSINPTINVDVQRVSSDMSWELILIISGGVFLLLLGLIAIPITYAIYRMRRKRNENLRSIYEQFKYGNQETASAQNTDLDDYLTGVPDAEFDMYQKIIFLPFSKALEILPHRLELDNSTVLGSGAFGIVYKGILDENQVVAVKTVPKDADPSLLAALLSEVKIMSYVGQHPNIVQLLGAQIIDLRKGIALVVVEFCSRGSLEDVLHAKRRELERFPKYVKSPYNIPGYMDFEFAGNPAKPFSTYQLLTFCHQVSSAMEFLADKRIIHGDLAARNVLLDANFAAKISDFGLSRQIYDNYKKYVMVSKETALPWRWLAIETLQYLKFSSESDVWAFGVFMWEVFSLGDLPYSAGISWGPHFMNFLEHGYRLEIPQYANQQIFQVMRRCWEENPSNRIRFQELSITLLKFLETEYKNK